MAFKSQCSWNRDLICTTHVIGRIMEVYRKKFLSNGDHEWHIHYTRKGFCNWIGIFAGGLCESVLADYLYCSQRIRRVDEFLSVVWGESDSGLKRVLVSSAEDEWLFIRRHFVNFSHSWWIWNYAEQRGLLIANGLSANREGFRLFIAFIVPSTYGWVSQCRELLVRRQMIF